MAIVSVQIASAATTYPTYSFVTASPNPVGIGQSVLVLAFLDRFPPANAVYIPYELWKFTVTVTYPTGNVQTQRLTSDTIGGAYFTINPSVVGTWQIKLRFEGAGPIAGNNNNTYAPSESRVFQLTVQQEPVKEISPAELPTGYWQRPINTENREWNQLAGNWIGLPAIRDSGVSTWDGVNCYNPYSKAPNSAHVVWAKPVKVSASGIAGSPYSTEAFYTGDSYERLDRGSFIMNGIYYRNLPQTNNNYPGTQTQNYQGWGFEAIDLRTGELLFKTTNGSLTFGQLLMYDSMNQHGIIPYLWNTNANQMQVFDAEDGRFLLQFANITAGSRMFDERGNLLMYVLNFPQKTLSMWNSTLAILKGAPAGQTGFGINDVNYWRPYYGQTYNWLKGVQWNITIPDLAADGVAGNPAIWMLDRYDNVLIARYASVANDTYPIGYVVYIGYSMIDGHQIWVKKYTDINQVETGSLGGASIGCGPGRFFFFKQETLEWNAYDANTGNYLWTTEPFSNPWGTYYTTLSTPPGQCAFGNKFFAIGYDGMIHCYDTTDGRNLWNALGYPAGSETPYGSWPTSYMAFADGKVYVSNGEHSPNQPLYRGYKLYCLDANTGQLLWSVASYAQSPMIADGYLLTLNGYDLQNYVFGKGLSATTVQAPLTGIAAGETFAVTGTVTDQSPGTTCLGIPAAGTPAISDDSMSAWMEYLYMQKPQPTNATGVTVDLVAIDSSGAATSIGTATSDSLGFYNTHWTAPTTPGDYKIVANFAGTNSYYASSAIAGLSVVAASPTPASASDVASEVVAQLPPAPTAPSASDVADLVVSQLPAEDNTLLYAVIAVVIITLLMCIVNLALLTKKK